MMVRAKWLRALMLLNRLCASRNQSSLGGYPIPLDTIGDLKKMVAAQTGTRADKIVLKKWYTIFKDHIQLVDYEIHDGMNLELYYQ